MRRTSLLVTNQQGGKKPADFYRHRAPDPAKQLTAHITRASSWQEACCFFSKGLAEHSGVNNHQQYQSRVQFWIRALLRRCGKADWTVCLDVFHKLRSSAAQCSQQQQQQQQQHAQLLPLTVSENTRAALVYGLMMNWRLALKVAVGSAPFAPLQLPIVGGTFSEKAQVIPVLDTALRSAAQAGAWAACLALFAKAGFRYDALDHRDFLTPATSTASSSSSSPHSSISLLNVAAASLIYARFVLSMMVALLAAQYNNPHHQHGEARSYSSSSSSSALIPDSAARLFNCFHLSRSAVHVRDSDEFTIIALRVHTTYCRILARAGMWEESLRVGTQLAPWPAAAVQQERQLEDGNARHRGARNIVAASVPDTKWTVALRALAVAGSQTWVHALAISEHLLTCQSTSSLSPAQTQTWERVFCIEAWRFAPVDSVAGERRHEVADHFSVSSSPLEKTWLAAMSSGMETARSTDAMRMRCSIALASVFQACALRVRQQTDGTVTEQRLMSLVSRMIARGIAVVNDQTRLWTLPLLCCIAESTAISAPDARQALERALEAIVKVNATDFVHRDVHAACALLVDCAKRRRENCLAMVKNRRHYSLQPVSVGKIRSTLSGTATLRDAPWVFELQILLLMELQAPCLSATEIKQRSEMAVDVLDKWRAHEMLNGTIASSSLQKQDSSDDINNNSSGSSNSNSHQEHRQRTTSDMAPLLLGWLESHKKHVAAPLLDRVRNAAAPPLDEVDLAVSQQIEAALSAKQDAIRGRFCSPLPRRASAPERIGTATTEVEQDDDGDGGDGEALDGEGESDCWLTLNNALDDSGINPSSAPLHFSRQMATSQLSPERIQQSLLRCAQHKLASTASTSIGGSKSSAASPAAEEDAVTIAFQAAVAARKNTSATSGGVDSTPSLSSAVPSFVPNSDEWSRLLLEHAMTNASQWQRAHFLFLRGYQHMSLEEICRFVRFDLNRGGNVSALVAVATAVVPKLAASAVTSSSSHSWRPLSVDSGTAAAAAGAAGGGGEKPASAMAAEIGVEAFLRCDLWRSALRFIVAIEERSRGTLQRADLSKLLSHPSVPPRAVLEMRQHEYISEKQFEELCQESGAPVASKPLFRESKF